MTNPFGSPQDDDNDDVFEFDGVDESSGFAVPAGVYRARVIELEKGESKAGNPMWIWTFLLLQGEEAGLGRELKMWTALTPAAKWKVNETIKALQLPTTDGRMRLNKKDIVGKECVVEVEDSTYQDRVTSSIKICKSLDEVQVKGPTFQPRI